MKRALAVLTFLTFALLVGATDARAQCKSQRVKFERGASTASLRGRVSAGRAVCYELRARAGQRMSVRLTSTRKAVRFGVMPPGFDREPLVEDVTNWEAVLEEDGDYAISLSVPRGSDFYTFEVTVSAPPGRAK
jgi:hypothetical protein